MMRAVNRTRTCRRSGAAPGGALSAPRRLREVRRAGVCTAAPRAGRCHAAGGSWDRRLRQPASSSASAGLDGSARGLTVIWRPRRESSPPCMRGGEAGQGRLAPWQDASHRCRSLKTRRLVSSGNFSSTDDECGAPCISACNPAFTCSRRSELSAMASGLHSWEAPEMPLCWWGRPAILSICISDRARLNRGMYARVIGQTSAQLLAVRMHSALPTAPSEQHWLHGFSLLPELLANIA